MYAVEKYLEIRRAHFEHGLSQRTISQQYGISRVTISKMLSHSIPPGYRQSEINKESVLDPYKKQIESYLEIDKVTHRKQRHTSKRIYDRLVSEEGYLGSYHTVRRYVNKVTSKHKEVFIPLVHPPGKAQVDFGEADVIIAGKKERAHYFVMDLPHSDACFVKAYPMETTEAFIDGHNSAFKFFKGVPQEILYDNTKIAVARILSDRQRQRTRYFTELLSHYLFIDKFGRPGKGNDKGNVEGMVGYYRRNFMVPVPRFDNYEAFNAYLEECCINRMREKVQGEVSSIGEKFMEDIASFKAEPVIYMEPCLKIVTAVNSMSLVRYKNNNYSVPVAYAHQVVAIKAYVDEIKIIYENKIIAEHKRSYEAYDSMYNPLHYLPLIEQKVESLDQAAPLQNWELPLEFSQLRRKLEGRLGRKGRREYVQILQLLNDFSLAGLHEAIIKALRLSTISYDAVKHLLLHSFDQQTTWMDLENYPFLKDIQVWKTQASTYMTLLQET